MAFRRLASIAALAALIAGCASHENLARSALQESRLNDAADEVQLAVAQNPDSPEVKTLAAAVYTNRGAKFYYSHQISAARGDLERAVGYDPNYSAAWDYLGLVAFSEHNWKDAIADGARAGSLAGRPPAAYVGAARTQLGRERPATR